MGRLCYVVVVCLYVRTAVQSIEENRKTNVFLLLFSFYTILMDHLMLLSCVLLQT